MKNSIQGSLSKARKEIKKFSSSTSGFMVGLAFVPFVAVSLFMGSLVAIEAHLANKTASYSDPQSQSIVVEKGPTVDNLVSEKVLSGNSLVKIDSMNRQAQVFAIDLGPLGDALAVRQLRAEASKAPVPAKPK